MFSRGRDHDLMMKLGNYRTYKGSWATIHSNDTGSSLNLLDFDPLAIACMQSKIPSSIAVARTSDSNRGPATWKPIQIKSIDHWPNEHDTLFGVNCDPLVLAIAVSSRIFPLVPSPAVSEYLSTKFRSRPTQSHDPGCLVPIEVASKRQYLQAECSIRSELPLRYYFSLASLSVSSMLVSLDSSLKMTTLTSEIRVNESVLKSGTQTQTHAQGLYIVVHAVILMRSCVRNSKPQLSSICTGSRLQDNRLNRLCTFTLSLDYLDTESVAVCSRSPLLFAAIETSM